MFFMTTATFLALLKLNLLLVIGADNAKLNDRCGPGINTAGWTFPKGDLLLEVGTSLNISCHLDLDNPTITGHTANDIVFRKGNHLIDSTYVKVINSSTAELHMDNLTISNEMIYCVLILRNDSTSDNAKLPERLICMNYLMVGSKPKNVSDFRCISYNWETLNCTWNQPNNGVKTNYSIYYQVAQRSGRSWFNCPMHQEGKCTWTLQTSPSYRRSFEYLLFLIEGVNKFGNNSQRFKINHYANMIPSAPNSLIGANETISSVCLQWNIGALQFFDKGFDYKVEYAYNSSSHNVTIYHSRDVLQDGGLVRVNVSDLKYPNTLYHFRVYMKSSIAIGDMWSPAMSLIAKTKPCKPFYSPETDIGSFEIRQRHSTSRDIYVYWKQIPKQEQNGDDFKYEVKVFENGQQHVKPISITNTYAKFQNFSYNEYKFEITSVNDQGYASVPTIVRVPKQIDIVPEPILFHIVDFANGTLELSWKLSNRTDQVQNFTIFWNEICQSLSDSVINWMHLPANSTSLRTARKADDRFAISVNSMNSSSGMVWASCTILHSEINKIKNVWIGRTGSTFIEVRWILECSERVKGIRGYNIVYCPIPNADNFTCKLNEKSFLVYGDLITSNANITDLEPRTFYKISIAIFTDQFTGPASDGIWGRTAEKLTKIKDIDIIIKNITDHSAIVEWSTPNIQNYTIDHYVVHCNDNVKIVNSTSIELNGLMAYTFYNVEIFVCTATFCAQSETIIALHTKIGVPSEVIKLNVKMIDSNRTVLSWDPPIIPAGPSPIYEVKLEFNKPDKQFTEQIFETTTTAVNVEGVCQDAHLSFTIFIRAKNYDDSNPKNIQEYIGPWSSPYTVDCLIVTPFLFGHYIFLLSVLTVILIVVIVVMKKADICERFRFIDIAVPEAFLIPGGMVNPMYDDLRVPLHSVISQANSNESRSPSQHRIQRLIDNNLNGVSKDARNPVNQACANGSSKSKILRIKSDDINHPLYQSYINTLNDENEVDIDTAAVLFQIYDEVDAATALIELSTSMEGDSENVEIADIIENSPDQIQTKMSTDNDYDNTKTEIFENSLYDCVEDDDRANIEHLDKVENSKLCTDNNDDRLNAKVVFSPKSPIMPNNSNNDENSTYDADFRNGDHLELELAFPPKFIIERENCDEIEIMNMCSLNNMKGLHFDQININGVRMDLEPIVRKKNDIPID